MLEIGNAKERDFGECHSLLEQTDLRFRFKGMKQPPNHRGNVGDVKLGAFRES